MKLSMRSNLLILFIFSASLQGSLNDYVYPRNLVPSFSNYGTTGVIQTPNARFHEAGTLAFSWSANDPYMRGSILAYPFSWFEASYQYTDIDNALYSNVEAFSGDQTYKDKSFDVKFLLWNETKFLPSVAIGARDIGGTGVFSSEFIVGSKRFNNIDLSIGLGWGMLSDNKFRNPLEIFSDRFKERERELSAGGGEFNTGTWFSGPTGGFASFQYTIPNFKGIRFSAEYDSTDYDLEGFPDGRNSFKFAFEPVRRPTSNINYGLMFPVNNSLQLKLGYMKGNTISFGFSLHANLGKQNPIFKKNDPPRPVPQKERVRMVNRQDASLYRTSLRLTNERGLFYQHGHIHEDDSTYEVTFAQAKFTSFARSTGRLIRVLDDISPEKIKTFKVNNINGGLGMYSLTIDRDEFARYKEENLYKLATKNVKLEPYHYSKNKNDYNFNPQAEYPVNYQKLTPILRTQLGGPDGFFFADLRIAYKSEFLISQKLSIYTDMSMGIFDNLGELKLLSDSIIPHVRTDIVKYLKATRQKPYIKRIQMNYYHELSENIYSKLAGGIFEDMFIGLGGEILYRPYAKNFGIGAEIWGVQQRDFRMLFGTRDYKINTGHINIYLKEPTSQVLVQIKGGRFLAGDSGIQLDFSRRFKSGLRIGAFATKTDISDLEFGEGSFDKGFYFYIPIESFFQKYMKGNTGWGLRPLTRDGAAVLQHQMPLWGVTEQGQRDVFDRDWDDFYE